LVWRRDRERSVRSNWFVMPIKIIRESGSDGHSKIRYKTLCYSLTSWSIPSRTSIFILCFFSIKKFSKGAENPSPWFHDLVLYSIPSKFPHRCFRLSWSRYNSHKQSSYLTWNPRISFVMVADLPVPGIEENF
jgi:hypothetical protein